MNSAVIVADHLCYVLCRATLNSNCLTSRAPTGWRGGAMAGRRTCDQEVASSISGQARLRNDYGQVVHTQLLRR